MKPNSEKMDGSATAKANELLNGDYTEWLAYACARWQDEKEYEDWTEYVKIMRTHKALNGAEVIKVSKRPFGVTLSINGFAVQLSATASGRCQWKRVSATPFDKQVACPN